MVSGSHENRIEQERLLNKAFSPHAPISDSSLFAGRINQIRAVADTIARPGLHAAIYGERGVGKTSLSNIIKDFLSGDVAVSRVNCAHTDTFASVVKRSLEAIHVTMPTSIVGFGQREEMVRTQLLDLVPEEGSQSPDRVASVLAQLPLTMVLVIDEFDRIPKDQTAVFADFIKSLSDRGAQTKVVIVGVAEDIDTLIASHMSVERCLRQIPMPRMLDSELRQIIQRGLDSAGLVLSSEAPQERILTVSQGFPHYTHLLALSAGRAALDANRTTIDEMDVIHGMVRAVDDADQRHRETYHTSTTGVFGSLWREVVTACALAESDERGYFSINAVQEALSLVLSRPVVQQTVSYHLGKLIDTGRGQLLERSGARRRYRYRFANPLMRPFILMKAMNDRILPATLWSPA